MEHLVLRCVTPGESWVVYSDHDNRKWLGTCEQKDKKKQTKGLAKQKNEVPRKPVCTGRNNFLKCIRRGEKNKNWDPQGGNTNPTATGSILCARGTGQKALPTDFEKTEVQKYRGKQEKAVHWGARDLSRLREGEQKQRKKKKISDG